MRKTRAQSFLTAHVIVSSLQWGMLYHWQFYACNTIAEIVVTQQLSVGCFASSLRSGGAGEQQPKCLEDLSAFQTLKTYWQPRKDSKDKKSFIDFLLNHQVFWLTQPNLFHKWYTFTALFFFLYQKPFSIRSCVTFLAFFSCAICYYGVLLKGWCCYCTCESKTETRHTMSIHGAKTWAAF